MVYEMHVPNNALRYNKLTWRPRSSKIEIAISGYGNAFRLDVDWLTKGGVEL